MKAAPPCAHCRKPLKIIPILCGYPDSDAFEAERRGEVVLAGRMVSDNDPKWACSHCHKPVRSALDADRPRFRLVQEPK